MAYKGRILGLGRTEEGSPAAVYGVSGRSEGSKTRVARYIDDGFIRRVQIEPSGKMTDEQKKKAHLFFYNAILTIPGIKYTKVPDDKGAPYLVVSNGVHTDTIANVTLARPERDSTLFRALELFQSEPDSLNTPRIAGELNIFGNAKLGIVTVDILASDAYDHDELEAGKFKTIATYSGKDDEHPTAPVIEKGDLKSVLEDIVLKGNNATELAKSFYDSIDQKYVVCAAAAVWKNGAWDIAVKNLHEVKNS
jgi:IMP cyclohydrolase